MVKTNLVQRMGQTQKFQQQTQEPAVVPGRLQQQLGKLHVVLTKKVPTVQQIEQAEQLKANEDRKRIIRLVPRRPEPSRSQ